MKEEVSQIIVETDGFSIGDVFSHGFDIFKKQMGLFIGFFVLSTIIGQVLAFIPLLGPIAQIIISPILSAGYIFVAYKVTYDKPVEFSNFFDGFKNNPAQFVIISLLTLLIIGVLAAIIVVPIFFTTFSFDLFTSSDFSDPYWLSNFIQDYFPTIFIAFGILIIPMVYIGISLMYAPHFVIFGKMEAWEAIKASRRFTNKHFFSFLGLLVVIMLLNIAGVLALFVGILFTAPASVCIIYAVFDRMVVNKLEGDNNIDDNLERHLVE